MKMLKVGAVKLALGHHVFPLLDDMAKTESVIRQTLDESLMVDVRWMARLSAELDPNMPSVQKVIALSALLDSDEVFSGWRDLDYLVIDWDEGTRVDTTAP